MTWRSAVRWGQRVAITAVLGGLVVVPLTVLLVIGSEWGTRALLSRVLPLVNGPERSIALRLDAGNLLDGVTLSQVTYTEGELSVRVERASFRWSLDELLKREWRFTEFNVSDVTVDLPAPAPEPVVSAAPTLPSFASPLAITIERVVVERLALRQNGQVQTMQRLAFGAALDETQIRLTALKLAADAGQLAGEMTLRTAAPHAVSGRLDFTLDVALAGLEDAGIDPLRGELAIDEAALQPNIALSLDTPIRLTASAALRLDRVVPEFSIDAQWESVPWPLSGQAWLQLNEGTLTLEGNADVFQGETTATLQGEGAPPAELVLRGGRAAGGVWLVDQLSILAAGNRLNASGSYSDTLDFTFQIDAPNLAQVDRRLLGRVQGEGRLTGTPNAPSVGGSVDASGLQLGVFAVETLALQADWRGDRGEATAKILGLQTPSRNVETLQATLRGSNSDHVLQLVGLSDGATLNLIAEGGLDEGRWEGHLNSLTLDEPITGTWQQSQPSGASVGSGRVWLEQLCLEQQRANVCLAGGLKPGGDLDLNLTARQVSLDPLNRLLPPGSTLAGRFAITGHASGSLEEPSVTLNANVPEGLFRWQQEGVEQRLDIGALVVDGELNAQRTQLRFNADVGPAGKASGTMALAPTSALDTPLGDRSLTGTIQADFPDLALVAGLAPALERLEGRLALESELGGKLNTPTLAGALTLKDATAYLPAAGITLDDGQLVVSGDQRGVLSLAGSVRSGDGTLNLGGTIDLSGGGRPALDVTIHGDEFVAVALPDATMTVSPALRLDGQSTYHLSGSVIVPEARLKVRELPQSTVSVSEDAEIIDGALHDAPAPSQRLTARVQVNLGDQVSFSGFGLETGLTGALLAVVEQDQTRLDGRIDLRDARYAAYGQDLTVQRGRLLFVGPPDNPDLDLLAVRTSRDKSVDAFLEVTGPLARPVSRVYSQPGLPGAEALAYLLTGRGLDRVSQGEGTNIAAAAIGLGLAKSDPLLQKLGDRFGLDQLTLENGDGGFEASALVVGKYLNPDLYLGYSQGLFNPEGTILLRLRLSENLELESRSGTERSADLFYRVEYD